MPLSWPSASVLHKKQVLNDVVFYFPRSNRELWANSAALKQASPHFKTSLESEFKEGSVPTEAFQGATPTEPADEDTLDDSDDESDKIAHKLAATRTSRTLPAGVREIVVTSTAYTTYYAVLVWMLYGFIDFAPLAQVSSAATPATAAHLARAATHAAPDPDLPLPASPKSVYKLAHFLELPDLMELALNNLKTQLTIDSALYQVVSDVALHDEVFDAISAFSRPRWQTIKGTQAAVDLGKPEMLHVVGLEGMGRLFELARRC